MSTKKVIVTYTAILAIMSFLLCSVFAMYRNVKNNLSRAESNVSSLTSKVDSFRTKNNELVTVTQNLQYTVKEAKEYNSELVKKIKELEVKPKNVQSVSEGTMTVHVNDTVYLEADDFGVYSGTWNDTWTSAYFEVKDTVLKFDYVTHDSLMVILYGQKERFNIFHPFRKRKTSYYTLAKLTRPNGKLVVKSVQFK